MNSDTLWRCWEWLPEVAGKLVAEAQCQMVFGQLRGSDCSSGRGQGRYRQMGKPLVVSTFPRPSTTLPQVWDMKGTQTQNAWFKA